MTPPLIWKEVEKTKNGKKLKIRMQQVTEDLMEPVVAHMTEFFGAREPISAHLKLLEDAASVNDVQNLWRETLKGGASIVAILLEDDGSVPATPNIVGVNVTGISCEGDNASMKGSGEAYQKLIKAVMKITKEGNIYKKYNVNKYLTALGLSVHKDFHGIGLGLDILNCREAVCKMFGLTLTATVFTAGVSQYIAAKGGFEVVLESDYKDLEVDGTKPLSDMPGKISLMAKRYV